MSWTHTFKSTLPAPPAAVFSALTETTQLTQWFSEHVEIGSAIGEPFRFWGRHTLDTPTAADATQRITRWTPSRELGFTWRIGQVDTNVVLTLSEKDTSCVLEITHAVDESLPYVRQRELLDDHWRFVFGNLAAHLGGGEGIVLPDFLDPEPSVRLVLTIEARPETVFRTLIEPEYVNQWLGSTTTIVEPHEGGRFEVGWKYKVDGRDVVGGPTRILEFQENRQLTLDWPDWRGDDSITGQTISFSLEPVGDHTRLTFVHRGFTRTTDISDFPFGWAYFLGSMKTLATARTSAR